MFGLSWPIGIPYQTTSNYNWWWFDSMCQKNGFRIRMISSLRKSHRRPAARRYSSRKSAWQCFIYGKHLPINLYSLDTCHIYLSVLSYGQEIVNEATQLPSAGPNSNMNRPVPTCGSTNCRFWKINIDLTFSFLSFKVYDCVDEYTVGFKWIYCRIWWYINSIHGVHLPPARAPCSRHRPSKRLQRKRPNLASWHSWIFLDVVVPFTIFNRTYSHWTGGFS